MATPSLLIIVTFLAGNVWGPQVSTQTFPNAEICSAAMNAVGEAIISAAKSNMTAETIIEKISVSELKIITGVNQRTLAVIKCS